MRAVNLIPVDERRGGIGVPGRSNGGVYVLLGALAVLLVVAVSYVLLDNSVKSRQGELAHVRNQTSAAETQAAVLRPYREFGQLRQTRVQTVASLAASRFDWDRVLRQLARVLPADVWLTSLNATIAPGVSLGGGGGGGATSSLRGALQVPAVELVGCTLDQSEVSRVLTRLRLMQGVTRVSLASSEKLDAQATAATSGTAGGAGDTDCRHGSSRFPQFQAVVFFGAPTSIGAPSGVQPGAPQPGAVSNGPAATQPTSAGAKP